ncbi:MAG: hypothetical protein [Cressdnaviricota sp.]|nr:MAG: hypothetical protein [Cressdnaviricota sp.]
MHLQHVCSSLWSKDVLQSVLSLFVLPLVLPSYAACVSQEDHSQHRNKDYSPVDKRLLVAFFVYSLFILYILYIIKKAINTIILFHPVQNYFL